MPPRRELPLRGARDDPKAWPPSSAPLRLASQRRPSIARGSVAMTQAPVHPDTRTCLELLWALAVTELLAALLRDLGLALRLLQQIVNATHGHCSRGPDPRATKGIAPRALPHPVALSRRCPSPLRRPNHAECCSEPRSSPRRAILRPSPLRRTRRPATPRARGQRHERDVGRGTSRPGTKHVEGLPSVRAPRGTCVWRVPARAPTEHLLSPTRRASRDGSRPPDALPAEAAVVSPPREGRRRTSAEMLSTTWNRLTEGIAPCWRVGRDSGVRPPCGTLHDEALTLFCTACPCPELTLRA
jgi:hypothetical protein